MIKPLYFVYDSEAKRYIHNTTRDFGIYSSKAEEFFSREDVEKAYSQGMVDYIRIWDDSFTFHQGVEEMIEHDGKPYKESE